MCEWGNEIEMRVLIPAQLSHTGEQRWAVKGVDACIADIVQALNDAGIHTASCCCGHHQSPGNIILHDGRQITITPAPDDDVK